MASGVHIRPGQVNTAEVKKMLDSAQGGVARDLLRRGKNVEGVAKRLTGVDTGRLRSSITTELLLPPAHQLRARVGTNVTYATYHHEGTGLYGPHKTRIRPTRAKVLRFTIRGVPGPIFARSVRGAPGTHFLKRALDAARH